MKFIIKRVEPIICKMMPEVDLSPLPVKTRGQLWLDPGRFLGVIQAPIITRWALSIAARVNLPRLKGGPGGRPTTYDDDSILLMAIVQTAWRMSYADIVDYVASLPTLPSKLALGPTRRQNKSRRFAKANTGNGGPSWGFYRCCSFF